MPEGPSCALGASPCSSAPLTVFSLVVVSGTRAAPGVVIWQACTSAELCLCEEDAERVGVWVGCLQVRLPELTVCRG